MHELEHEEVMDYSGLRTSKTETATGTASVRAGREGRLAVYSPVYESIA
jgi:hypothetical protein